MHSCRGMGKSGRVQPAPNRLTHSRLSVSGAIDCSTERRVSFLLSGCVGQPRVFLDTPLTDHVTAVGSNQPLVQ